MTVPVNDRRKEYTGNGVTTVFTGPRAFAASHVAVYSIVTATKVATLVSTSLYTLAGVNSNGATTVTMATAPASTITLLILRTVVYTQETDITNQGSFLPEVIEDGFDTLEQQIQQLGDRQDRSVRLSDTSTYAGSLELPVPQARYVLGWNAAEDGLENVDPGAEDLNGFVIDATAATGQTYTATDWPAASAMTYLSGERFVRSFRNSRVSGDSMYQQLSPGVIHFDALQGVTHVPNGTTVGHLTGVAGYIKTDSPIIGILGPNAVALFGLGQATANNTAVWGINTLLMDQATRVVGTLTGIGLYNELDFNVMNPGTTVQGLTLGGNSLAQPAFADGFVVNQLGTGIKWSSAFLSNDGAAVIGMSLGALASTGSSINSQKLLMGYRTAAAARESIVFEVQNGGFLSIESSAGSFLGLSIAGASLLLATGKSVTVNGNQIISDRRTGWAATTGTQIRTNFGDASLSDTSQALRALIVDLKAHGLIGV